MIFRDILNRHHGITKVLLLLVICNVTCLAQAKKEQNFIISENWQLLLDEDLKHWETFIGVPHTSVILEGAQKSDDVHVGTPLGLGNDPKEVFSVIKEKDEHVLKVTGEIYGGLTTLQEFGNYHLRVKFKWGDKKWEPRLDKKRDNGILYHCHGKHGAFWNVWMSSLECQIQEGDTGDFVTLVHARAEVSSKKINEHLYKVTSIDDEVITYGAGNGNPGYCHINNPNEKPNGDWNVIEVLCVGNQSVHVVNGKVVMVVKNTRKVIDGEEIELTSGKIQLQSEGAEGYYKDIEIKAIKSFPKKIKKQIKQS